MSGNLLNLPINIPWCQVAVTENMMDQRSGSDRFPIPWRSSLAISAYEPKTEDLPEEFADQKVTYLKITCSITGYQPTEAETDQLFVYLDDKVADPSFYEILLREYFACYGALLNVSVLPVRLVAGGAGGVKIGGEDLSIYPHIIAFEPKVRDLYQAATTNGEVLTSSRSGLTTDKTLLNTENTETGIAPKVTLPNGAEISGLTHKWGETDQDSRSVQTESSKERRETQGTTTQLSQMYNLLAGYHQGTNRATWLMLPRPHTMQTEFRTFTQGLRVIEGVQEFMLIVARPSEIEGLCIEASLDTGHFPENVDFIVPDIPYETREVQITHGPIKVDSKWNWAKTALIRVPVLERDTKSIDSTFTIDDIDMDGFEFDPTKDTDIKTLDNDNASGQIEGFSIQKQANSLIVKGQIKSSLWPVWDTTTTYHREYTVHLRRQKGEPGLPRANEEKLLVTRRGLDVCIQSGECCPEVITSTLPDSDQGEDDVVTFRMASGESIVDERKIRIHPASFTRGATQESRPIAVKELLRQIHNTMATSWRQPTRYPAGTVGYLESDYFKERVMELMPRDRLERPVSRIEDMPKEVIDSLGEQSTVAEALEMDLGRFARKTGLSVEKAAKVRRRLLGIRPESSDDVAQNSGYFNKNE